mmetsp:Transcript_16013/g.23655  ORF Transcript_16013/g.23655 Transcript_16013/m.23655 type:complete len:111 (-) Transcript_16013:7-339(-)
MELTYHARRKSRIVAKRRAPDAVIRCHIINQLTESFLLRPIRGPELRWPGLTALDRSTTPIIEECSYEALLLTCNSEVQPPHKPPQFDTSTFVQLGTEFITMLLGAALVS